AGVLAEDRLFSTLDSTVRRFLLPDGRPILISDTVGFVRRLPHHLVEAFRSTLEEVKKADLLLHLVDSADPEPEGQIAAVHEVLEEIGARQVPELLVLNKVDAVEAGTIARLRNLHPEAVVVSALEGTGIADLVEALSERLVADVALVRLEVPYSRSDIVAAAHREGEVVAEKHEETGSVLEVRLPKARLPLFEQFVTG
ncbi:MAG: HflX GTPase family protein, partial [Acidimicrobiia bacterium]